MKTVIILTLIVFSFNSWGQVGIGTTNPDPNVMLDVQGTIKIVDGTQGANKTLVSDANGTAEWRNENDGVNTRVIRNTGGGTSDVVIWSHPSGIEVRFNAGTETVTVENKTGDSTHYWDVVIYGGATGRDSVQATNYKADFIRNDGTNDTIFFDLGSNNMGWFNIIVSDQNNEQDGFIIHIVYYDDNLNGIVQYWDN
jgi:hypothetical protein